jgi:hypothetical protein
MTELFTRFCRPGLGNNPAAPANVICLSFVICHRFSIGHHLWFMRPNPKKRIETDASTNPLTKLEDAFPEGDQAARVRAVLEQEGFRVAGVQ